MGLSFRSKIFLELLAGVAIATLAVFFWYLAILGALITFLLIFNELSGRKSEKTDFRSKIVKEALTILDRILLTTASHISCAKWESESEDSKRDLLGNRDYELWKQFYDSVEQRNEDPGLKRGVNWEKFTKFNQAILNSFFEAYNAMPWVKASIPEDRITSFLSRAKESVSL